MAGIIKCALGRISRMSSIISPTRRMMVGTSCCGMLFEPAPITMTSSSVWVTSGSLGPFFQLCPPETYGSRHQCHHCSPCPPDHASMRNLRWTPWSAVCAVVAADWYQFAHYHCGKNVWDAQALALLLPGYRHCAKSPPHHHCPKLQIGCCMEPPRPLGQHWHSMWLWGTQQFYLLIVSQGCVLNGWCCPCFPRCHATHYILTGTDLHHCYGVPRWHKPAPQDPHNSSS